MKLFILAKINRPAYRGDEVYEEELILSTYYNVKGSKLNKKHEAAKLNTSLTMETVEKHLKAEDPRSTLVDFTVLPKPAARWVSGEYYAHEYDEYVEGRARIVKWTKDYHELEVECLDKEKCVADGVWEYDPQGSRQDNGCGDWFAPYKALK